MLFLVSQEIFLLSVAGDGSVGRSCSFADGGYGDSFFVRDLIVAFVVVLLSPRNIFAVRGEGSVEVAGECGGSG